MSVRHIFFVLLLAGLVNAGGLALYDHLIRKPQTPRFALLDVSEIYTQKTRLLLASATSATAADPAQQGAVAAEVDRFNAQAITVVRDISRECSCVLLARPAVVESVSLPDYTDVARERLGL